MYNEVYVATCAEKQAEPAAADFGWDILGAWQLVFGSACAKSITADA